MRKYITVLASVLLLSSLAFGYNDDGNVNKKLESGGLASDPARIYTLVRYAESADLGGPAASTNLSQGDVVGWDLISDDGVTVARISDASSTDAVAGVVVSTLILTQDGQGALTAANSNGSRNWGYIQVYGLCAHANVQATVAAGQALFGSTVDRYAGPSLATAAAPRPAERAFGFAMDAVATTATDVEIFIINQ